MSSLTKKCRTSVNNSPDRPVVRAQEMLRDPQQQKVVDYLCRLAKLVTKPTRYGFQVVRRDREDGDIEYQIFADTKGHGTQIAWVQSTKHDADFIAACLAQAPLFEQLLKGEADRPSPPSASSLEDQTQEED